MGACEKPKCRDQVVVRYYVRKRLGWRVLRVASFGNFYQETLEYGFSAAEVREGDTLVG